MTRKYNFKVSNDEDRNVYICENKGADELLIF